MPALVQSWKFEQLTSASGSPKKSFILSDAQAPHGRPRQKPIVSDGIEVREKTIYYPDNDVPTRHIFGVKYDDWELQGRFRDAYLGHNGSNKLVDQITDFVKDAQTVQISWGDIIAVTGLIKSFKPMREAFGEIAWSMRILIDLPTNRQPAISFKNAPTPSSRAKLLQQLLGSGIVQPLQSKLTLQGLTGSFIDSVESLVSSINSFSGALVDATNEFSNFSSALIGQIERVRAGIHQIRTAIITLRNIIQAQKAEATLLYRSADSDVNWYTQNNGIQLTSLTALALLQDLDNQAEQAQRQKSLTSYVARSGDSWEIISIKFYGGPENATAIRNANGVRYGNVPIVGVRYQIPIVI